MTIQEKRELLYRELQKNIKMWSRTAVDQVAGKAELFPSADEAAYGILRERLTSDEDLEALRSVISWVQEGLIHSILCMFDGVTYINDFFTPAIIDSKTREELAPEGTTYHDDFFDFLPFDNSKMKPLDLDT